jgi:hypothetical protein
MYVYKSILYDNNDIYIWIIIMISDLNFSQLRNFWTLNFFNLINMINDILNFCNYLLRALLSFANLLKCGKASQRCYCPLKMNNYVIEIIDTDAIQQCCFFLFPF